MEHALWGYQFLPQLIDKEVLILILMEDSLWVLLHKVWRSDLHVLILILLEDTLWGVQNLFKVALLRNSLNPYSNGRYSMGALCLLWHKFPLDSLNPYSNGRYSMRHLCHHHSVRGLLVLILILMEDTLWVQTSQEIRVSQAGLNPYSNGRYSMS